MRYVFVATGSWEVNPSFERIRQLSIQMLARGVEVGWVIDGLPFNRNMVLPEGVEVEFVGGHRTLAQFWQRRRAIRALRPDFVHIINPSPKGMAALIGSKWKVVGDWDEWAELRVDHRFPMWAEKCLAGWLRNRAAVTVVCSRYMQREFSERFGITAHYVPYAVTENFEKPDTVSPFDRPTVVYMGSMVKQYDHDIAFHAADLLARAGKVLDFAFIGGGEELGRWKHFVAENRLERVFVKGRVSDLERWRHLRHAHVLLFPIRPTLGNLARCPSKVYAYAHARRPTITCSVGEVPETLGPAAIYVDPTPEAFAQAIECAMSQPSPDVDYGIERHNWGARAEALLEALGG